MPAPKIRFYLHSKTAAPPLPEPGVGETRPVRQATGYGLHPAYYSATALHALKGADSYRTINEKLDELRPATQKACRRLEDKGQLSNAALAPLFKEAATSLHGRPAKLAKPAPVEVAPSTLPLTQQPMRLVLAD